jgi:V8-like Glu-specific endopeptidase
MNTIQSKWIMKLRNVSALLTLFGCALNALAGETVPASPATQSYSLDTGKLANRSTNYTTAFKWSIQATGKPSKVRVHFSSLNLGKRSYLTLISARDGSKQILDRISIGYWQNTSAIFNGDTVNLELTVAPGEEGVFAQVDQLVFECDCPEQVVDVASLRRPLTLCGTDSRVVSTDNRVGRISGCTAWLVSNGAVLTAGHCGPVSGVFEVNVPASSSSGVTVASIPEDQYPINTSHRTSVDNGKGDDYTVFDLLPNSTTGTRPHIRFGFFRMTRENPVAADNIRVTGFGVDNTPAGPVANCCAKDDANNCTHPNCNAQSRTLQTATGPYVSETVTSTNIFHSYKVDSEPANSGSPIIWNANGFTIGIHTHGGCASDGTGDNDGTSFENDKLEALLQSWPGANSVYVDATQPPTAPVENGSVFRPFNTVTEAVSSVVSGGRIVIVEGSYTKAAGNTMLMGADGKSFSLIAPVGTITIGN